MKALIFWWHQRPLALRVLGFFADELGFWWSERPFFPPTPRATDPEPRRTIAETRASMRVQMGKPGLVNSDCSQTYVRGEQKVGG
jgi:hypothetical protein